MKKIKLIFSLLFIVLSMSACTMAPMTTATELDIDETKKDVAASEYEINFDGLLSYMEDNQVVAGNATEMACEFIGATEGAKYLFKSGSTQVSLELYAFDKDNLNEKAKATIASVKENGYFESLEHDVAAVLSESEQFMMVCVPTGTDDDGMILIDRIHDKFKEFK